ncbi:MAG: DUF2062 domain-containing protein [Alphaproteobacteria bacterium]
MFKTRKKKKTINKLRDFIYPKIGFKRSIKYTGHRLGRMNASPYQIACGFAVGAGVSFTPFLGFHFIISAIIAFILRGSIVASAIGTIVGNPLTFPFIWAVVYSTGVNMLGIEQSADVGEIFLFTLEKFNEINSWHLLFVTSPSSAMDIWEDYVYMWSQLFDVIYPLIIGSTVWLVVVWAVFFAGLYPLIASYKKKRNNKLKKVK